MNKALVRYRATARIVSILNKGLERTLEKEKVKEGKNGKKSKSPPTQTRK